ncbi:MAG: vWA domain-containing protein, partial [Bacillota bacterium]
MKVKLLVLFNLIITIAVFSQNKSYFDLDPLSLKKTNAASAVQAGSFIEVKNDKVSMTMVPEGYFTLGTTSGLSNSKLDDNCQITFGHPYARTSFPVFSIDGTWYKPEEFFTSAGEQSLLSSGDTVKFTAIKKGQLSVSFYLYYQSSEQSIKLTCKVKNLDSSSHKLGLGLMLDPALGKNGDAVLALSGTYLKDSRIFQTSELLPELILWEKTTGAKGLGVSLKFDEQPGKVIAGNWNEIYEKQSPDLYNSVTGKLYDLYFKIYWNETNIAAGSEKSETASIKIIQPEFSSDLFLRWDLPSYLTLDNNIVFPQSLSTYLEIAKAGTGTITSGNLKMELPAELSSGTLTYTYGSAVPVFQKLDLTAKTIYENKTVEAIAKVYNGTVLIDEIHRFINIPETPVSDTGLVVSIDTLMTSRYPQVSFIFDVLNKSKGTKIVNLTSDNVFLYENNTRITDLSFGKDTTGGMNAADIVFALDVTGSMGNEIDAVKKNIVEFADSLTKGGYDYQLGLVTFLDYIENVYPFTKDVQKFQQTIAAQYAHGGDDLPENSLQALMESSKFNFRPNSRRIVVWITDANYHENDAFTKLQKQTVIDSLL